MIVPRETKDHVSSIFKQQIIEVSDALNDFFRVPHDKNLNAAIDAMADYQAEFIRYSAMQIQPDMELPY